MMVTGNSSSSLRSLQAGSKEASILLELLQGSSGQAFASKNQGWDQATAVCEWSGISCGSSGEIETINISESGLEGTIPQALDQLSTVVDILMASNNLQGSIPSTVLGLPKLKNIDLSFNSLEGWIPFPMSSSLEMVRLGHNKLTGGVPRSFANGLDKLKIFDVKYNMLTGLLPDLTATLPSIQSLDLSNNRFQGVIPASFASFVTLQGLYLSNNLLTGTIPRNLGDPRLSIREIYLHGNMLSGTLPASLADLSDLSTLFVDDNKLTGTIPPELCALDLNEAFFHDTGDLPNVDSSYSELFGSRHLQRGDPTSERDGCTSIACPAGYKSLDSNNKDGVFPCEPCDKQSLNPYIGSNHCFVLNQDAILTAIYQATNGPSWTGAQNWGDPNVAACNKEGVTCNGNGQVTSISLQAKGLSGTIPPDLGFLDRLVTLDLSNNRIGGQLPAELGFAPLQSLDVAENQLIGGVPGALCQKKGLNGNGEDGIFMCDVIACRPGTHTSTGRASPGEGGEKCRLCEADTNPYLGTIDCIDEGKNDSAITPFGLVGEIAITVFGLTMICVVLWVWRRRKISTQYITDRAYFVHGPGKDDVIATQNDYNGDDQPFADSEEIDPLEGMDGLGRDGVANLEIKVKDEWNSGKEKSQKEVWLDVPKIS